MGCIMYKDITDCDKAPCGPHCRIYDAKSDDCCECCQITAEFCPIYGTKCDIRRVCQVCGAITVQESHCHEITGPFCPTVEETGRCIGGECDGCPDNDDLFAVAFRGMLVDDMIGPRLKCGNFDVCVNCVDPVDFNCDIPF